MASAFLHAGIVILFYTIFLGSLIIMFITCMAVFFWVSDWNFPPMQGVASILDSPGMGFRPQTKVHTTTISFFKGDTTTYTDYIDQIEAYLRCKFSLFAFTSFHHEMSNLSFSVCVYVCHCSFIIACLSLSRLSLCEYMCLYALKQRLVLE